MMVTNLPQFIKSSPIVGDIGDPRNPTIISNIPPAINRDGGFFAINLKSAVIAMFNL